MQVQSLGREDPLEEESTTQSSILAWRIPWTEEPGSYSPYGHKQLDMTEATKHYAWVDLEVIVLSQTEKDKYHMISLICGIYF